MFRRRLGNAELCNQQCLFFGKHARPRSFVALINFAQRRFHCGGIMLAGISYWQLATSTNGSVKVRSGGLPRRLIWVTGG
jgi:hypothetical protein